MRRKTIWLPNYVQPGLGDTPDEPDRFARADAEWSLRIGQVIDRHYPGYPWKIEADCRQGIAHVSIPVLMGGWTEILHLRLLQHDLHLRSVKEFAGRLLERWRVPRSALIDYEMLKTAPRLYGHRDRPPA